MFQQSLATIEKRRQGKANANQKMAIKCQMNPRIFKRLDSEIIQIVQAVAVKIKSQLNPEITHVANGAAKNSVQADSPRNTK
jgi:hypothetical protein